MTRRYSMRVYGPKEIYVERSYDETYSRKTKLADEDAHEFLARIARDEDARQAEYEGLQDALAAWRELE